MRYILFILGLTGLVLICLAEMNNPLTAKTMFYYLLSFMAIIESIALDIIDNIKNNSNK